MREIVLRSAIVLGALTSAASARAQVCSESNTVCYGWSETGNNSIAIYGAARGSGTSYGVYGYSDVNNASSAGVYGIANYGNGVFGQTNNVGLNGVEGDSASASAGGVYGFNSSGSGYGVAGRASGTGKAVYGDCNTQGGWAGYFNGKLFASSGYKPGGGSWTDSSDVRMKKDVKPLEDVLERMLKLRGVTYEWIEPEKHGNMTGRQTGMIAQEVEQVFPEWVGVDADGFKTLTFRGFEALSVEGMRTLNKENQALRLQVSSLEERVKKLENRGPVVMAGFSITSVGMLGAIALALGMLLASRRRDA